MEEDEGSGLLKWIALAGGAALVACLGIVPIGVALFLIFMTSDGSDEGGCGAPGGGTQISLSGGAAGVSGWDDDPKIASKQRSNVKGMIEQGVADGVPKQGLVVIVAATMVESHALELPFGDADSIGPLQQRTGWGSYTERLHSASAAHLFFTGGHGGQPGLLDTDGWEDMPIGLAAQDVQVSAYPHRYAEWADFATEVVDGFTEGSTIELASAESVDECAGKKGATQTQKIAFADASKWANPLTRGTPRSPEEAIAWARKQPAGPDSWSHRCLNFVARAYGYSHSGITSAPGQYPDGEHAYAIDLYRHAPGPLKHPKDRAPPPGALMFWDPGNNAGHVALYLGDGWIASNDIRRTGYIDIVPATAPEEDWGAEYLGWTPPYFPNGA